MPSASPFSRQLFSSLLLGTALCLSAQGSASARDVADKAIEACTQEPDRFDRLACFDALLGTPKSVIAGKKPILWTPETSSAPAPSKYENFGPLERIAHEMEDARPSGDQSWQFRYSRVGQPSLRTLQELIVDVRQAAEQPLPADFGDESGAILPEKAAAALVERSPEDTLEPGTANIYLTMGETLPADAAADERKTILMLSCEADITTARLMLPSEAPVRRNQVEVRVDGNIAERDIWQTSENDRVLMAARGLVSISHITKWIQSERLQFDVVVDGREKAIVFETSNLKELLQPLRRACRW
ncbi:type VI secretion system-associated protein TagO [Roseibium sediminis]|uniref:type VI secretion system-associated protein TagO n=1 Tax=Roseibium sediminis TaxID=1775174 RepID=UPI001375F514|nr:type VI secretion system-associated protein TagO [Roseibium sediminis]